MQPQHPSQGFPSGPLPHTPLVPQQVALIPSQNSSHPMVRIYAPTTTPPQMALSPSYIQHPSAMDATRGFAGQQPFVQPHVVMPVSQLCLTQTAFTQQHFQTMQPGWQMSWLPPGGMVYVSPYVQPTPPTPPAPAQPLAVPVPPKPKGPHKADRIKTKMCNYYERGICRWGANCLFAHGKAELRSSDANEDLLRLPQDPDSEEPQDANRE
jgi:hypothetical protein